MLFYLISILYGSNALPVDSINKIHDVNVMLNTTNLDINAKAQGCEDSSTFQIYTLSQATKICNLHDTVQQSLKENDFTKVMCPFGIIMFSDEAYPDDLFRYGAHMLANMIDADNSGTADNENVRKHLAHNGKEGHGMALVCGSTQEQEKKQDNLEGFTETFSCQTWKAPDTLGDEIIKNDVSEGIMFEEAFHLMQDGWAAEWPDVFCWKKWSCPICQETARLQCVKPGWHHPENKCPEGAPFSPGHPASSPLPPAEGEGCTNPNCDCAEFYRQAITLHMGWFKAGLWYSDYMPKNKEDFMNMASEELLNIMENPIYNQPLTPLTGVYDAECVLGMAPAD